MDEDPEDRGRRGEQTTVPTPDDSTPSGAEHPFEPSRTDDATRADRESLHPAGVPAADPDAGPGSPAERARAS